MTQTVYLAEPIDQANGRHQTGWGEARHVGNSVAAKLYSAGYNIYRPRTAWDAAALDPRVEEVNRHALACADAVVAFLPAGVPSIGVPMEIELASNLGMPVVALHDGGSFALAGKASVRVVTAVNAIADTLAEMLADPAFAPLPSNEIRLVIRDGFDLPVRAYPDDAGIDLVTSVGVVLEPRGYADIQTQVEATELPVGYWGLVTGRSSTIRKHGIHVPNGIIDPGWRGPLFVGAQNLTDEPVAIKVGERIGQLILLPNTPAAVRQVTQVSAHDRGTNGFGSSGA